MTCWNTRPNVGAERPGRPHITGRSKTEILSGHGNRAIVVPAYGGQVQVRVLQANCSRNAGPRAVHVVVGGKKGAALKGHTGLVLSLAFSQDGKLLVSGGAD